MSLKRWFLSGLFFFPLFVIHRAELHGEKRRLVLGYSLFTLTTTNCVILKCQTASKRDKDSKANLSAEKGSERTAHSRSL